MRTRSMPALPSRLHRSENADGKANLPEDAIYLLNPADETGKPLDGANRYTIHLDKGSTPPVNAFWSITMYDPAGFAYPNGLDR
jgi:hypothetical protein